ncbi:MAG: penicillin-binding protein 2 [Verrucomicrobia bacterium]|nr:penicillin-binding protein 2 [Verrucomicrobiota bacterium]
MSQSLQSRALIVCLALVAGFSVLSARLVHLQWLDRGDAVARAASLSSRTIPIEAPRGIIVDRNEEIMARNFPVTAVVADMQHLADPKVAAWGAAHARVAHGAEWDAATPEDRRRMVNVERMKMLQSSELGGDDIVRMHREHIARILARPLGRREDELLAELSSKTKGEMVLTKDLHEDVADPLEELVQENEIQGLFFKKKLRRWYSNPGLAVHVLGYTDHEGVGQCGIERTMEKYLAGKDGWRKIKASVQGRLLAPNEGELLPPRGGLHVKLTIDLGLQAIVEEELDAALAEYLSEQGTVILLDPKTGEILAMASRPHFDLNVREHVAEASFNYAIQAIYEPGSTLKVVATGAALDMGFATPGTQVFCHHGMLVEGRVRIPDHNPYGYLSLDEVLMKSSNIGTYKFAKQIGQENYMSYLNAYGFAQRTGIEMSGEQRGLVADPTNPTNYSRMAYGYGVSVTPLQVAMAYGAIANGGNLMQPRIIKEVVANNGMVVEKFEPRVVRQVMKERTSLQMRNALTKVVSLKGTASRAEVPGFKSLGKTGTAIKIGPNGRYMDGHYVVSFVGALPADDPAFVCVVVIDDPLTTEVNRYGGTIAAPTFAKIGERAAAYMNLVPTEPIEVEEEVLAVAKKD